MRSVDRRPANRASCSTSPCASHHLTVLLSMALLNKGDGMSGNLETGSGLTWGPDFTASASRSANLDT